VLYLRSSAIPDEKIERNSDLRNNVVPHPDSLRNNSRFRLYLMDWGDELGIVHNTSLTSVKTA